MPRRLSTILLAVAVLFANAYCACVTATGTPGRSNGDQVVVPQHEGCHGHGNGSEQQSEDSHDCGHCTGTVFADAPTVKSALSTPFVSPLFVASPASGDVAFGDSLCCNAINHTGLPPPVPRPTLLSLFCSLTN